VHPERGKDVEVHAHRLEEQEDGKTRHQEGPRRVLPPDLKQVADDLDHQQDRGRGRRHQDQRDQDAEAGVGAIESEEKIESAPDVQNDEDLGQQRDDDP
jgi:hypothetical protein